MENGLNPLRKAHSPARTEISMTSKSRLNKLAVLALIALLPAGGCVWGSVEYGRTLEWEKVDHIESGKTTPRNILDWFGPPEVIAKKGTLVPFPSLKTEESEEGEIREVDSNIFFKYFSKKHPITEQHVVYYYYNEGEDINGFSIPIPIGTFFISVPATFGDLQLSELWVLVNRKKGQVEDYVFLEGAEK